MNECFKVLGLTEDAGPEEVRRAYHRLAKDNHPDAGGDPAKFGEIHQAYRDAYRAAQVCPQCRGSGNSAVRRGTHVVKISCVGCRGSGRRLG